MFFVNVKHSIGHILVIAGPTDVKKKILVRYWVNYMTLAFDLTHDIDLGFSRSNL